MKKFLMLFLAAVLCVAGTVGYAETFCINGGSADRVHLRQTPSQSAKSLGLYFTGTDVTVAAWYDEWAHVVVGDVSGYMMSKYLTGTKQNRLGPWQMVSNPGSTWVNLRLSPSMDGAVALRPENGTLVRVLGETSEGWSYVECQGTAGYIRTDMLSAPEKKPIKQQTKILSEACSDGYIHLYVAPNGQELYFTSELEVPRIHLDDVNFDGWDDIVVMTISGASNAWYTFFTYDHVRDEYTHVPHHGAEFINYSTYPQYGIISSYGKNGNAGLLHVASLYRWEGNRLKLIRDAVSDEWSEYSFEGETYTKTIRGDLVHIIVRDYTNGYEGMVIFDRVFTKDEAWEGDALAQEQAALWQGIK